MILVMLALLAIELVVAIGMDNADLSMEYACLLLDPLKKCSVCLSGELSAWLNDYSCSDMDLKIEIFAVNNRIRSSGYSYDN